MTEGQEREQIALAYSTCKLYNLSQEDITSEEMQKELNKNGNNVTVTKTSNNFKVSFKETNNNYLVNQNGKISKVDSTINGDAIEKIVNSGNYGFVIQTKNEEIKYISQDKVKKGEIIKLNLDEAELITTGTIKEDSMGPCFVDGDGKVYVWGYNDYGQLGNGTTEDIDIPTCISDVKGSVLNGINVTKVCGRFLLDDTGKLYDLYAGEENNYLPICLNDIEGSILKGVEITDFYPEAGMFKDKNGKIYEFFWNNDFSSVSNIECINDKEGSILKGIEISEVFGDGYNSAIFISKNGEVYMSSYEDRVRRDPICLNNVSGSDLNSVEITDIRFCYERNTIIALDKSGKVYTWGEAGYGGLGDGTDSNREIPKCISDIKDNPLNGVKIISINTCGNTVIALDEAGKVYTWGDGRNGMLGDGSTESKNIPTCISNISESVLKNKKITNLINGNKDYKIVLDELGNVYMWGSCSALGNQYKNEYGPICINDIAGNTLNGVKVKRIYNNSLLNLFLDANSDLYYELFESVES